MPTPILATKLHIPSPRPKLVHRPHLIERLDEALERAPGLALISAPAGFGKTTLAAEWAAECERPIAWLSLDAGDNDPARFLAYLVAAIQTIDASIGENVLQLLDSPQPPPAETLLTALLNEIAALPDGLALVLDDYHLVDTHPVDQALTFVLEHLPPRMLLVIATRADPDLSLAWLRGRGQLTELRVADLRFTPAEAADFLNRLMGLDLSHDDVAALEARTEGWIAGLQLAAISMQGHTDSAGFVQSFTGSHRFVMDYLVEEVLSQQPRSVQDFLLRTSILDRLCGALCEAVLAEPSAPGQQTLETLERANLLVVPLDSRREWYRYHHLFAEVLQARLIAVQPDRVADLHRRACTWFDDNGFRPEAIRHALAARDHERAADLIEAELVEKGGTYFQSATWLSWVRALPDGLVRSRPRLSIGYAWELLFLGELEAADARLQDAARLVEPAEHTTDAGSEPVDDDWTRRRRAALAVARAFHAQALGDVAATQTHAHRALALLSEAEHETRGLAGSLLSLASWTKEDLEAAYDHLTQAVASLRTAGNHLFATTGAQVLADLRIAQGRLHDAAHVCDEALQLAAAQSEPVVQGTADLHLRLSQLNREWGKPEAAREHFRTAEQIGKQAPMPDWKHDLYLARARIQAEEGDLDGALKWLDEAARLHTRGPAPDLRPIGAQMARVWIRQGRLSAALDWARKQGLSVDDELSYLREFEHLTLARLLIAHKLGLLEPTS